MNKGKRFIAELFGSWWGPLLGWLGRHFYVEHIHTALRAQIYSTAMVVEASSGQPK